MQKLKAKSWKDYDALAKSYIAIGQDTVWLSEYDGVTDFPWEHVTRCEAGSSHRLDISTDITFYACGPSGLVFRWSFDIEPRSANGKGNYEIATGPIKEVMAKLPECARASLREYLAACATAVRAKADEWNEMVTKQYGQAAELEKLSK